MSAALAPAPHPEARFKTPADLRAHYKGVYARINTAGAKFEAEREAKVRERLKPAVEAKEALKRSRSEALAALSARVGDEAAPKTVWGIMSAVARVHGLTADDIIGPGKASKIVQARWEAIARAKAAFPKMSLPKLGKHFHRDHTTILHALRRVRIEPTPKVDAPVVATHPTDDAAELGRAITDAWAEGLNTVEIAQRLGRPPAEIANMLGYLRGASEK